MTYGLWGSWLTEPTVIQRLVRAGFPIWSAAHLDLKSPHSPLVEMFAIVEGESSSYLKAWHANIVRDPPFTGEIVYDEHNRMCVKSLDLGFLQINKSCGNALVAATPEAMEDFVTAQFDLHPELSRADLSALVAYDLWLDRGFKPWYAYKPGEPAYRAKKYRAARAVGNWAVHSFVGRIDPTGEPARTFPRLEYTT